LFDVQFTTEAIMGDALLWFGITAAGPALLILAVDYAMTCRRRLGHGDRHDTVDRPYERKP
jgi:hypothetical protein